VVDGWPPGVRVRHVNAGPFEGLSKEELPSQLCSLHQRACCGPRAAHPPGYYDLIHSHYWLSGQVGWLARDNAGVVPHVHTAAHPGQGQETRLIADG